jgi:hypothetical protein
MKFDSAACCKNYHISAACCKNYQRVAPQHLAACDATKFHSHSAAACCKKYIPHQRRVVLQEIKILAPWAHKTRPGHEFIPRLKSTFQVRLRGSIHAGCLAGWLSPRLVCCFARRCVGCMACPVACCLPSLCVALPILRRVLTPPLLYLQILSGMSPWLC